MATKEWKVAYCFCLRATEFEFSQTCVDCGRANKATLAFCAVKLLYLELQNAQAGEVKVLALNESGFSLFT
jgi:hypothetical protein